MAAALSARSYILAVPAIWYGGRPIQLSPKTVLKNVWPYFLSGFMVLASWFFLFGHLRPGEGIPRGSNLVVRILLSAVIASGLYIAGVIILQRSFRSIRDIISLIPHILHRIK